MRKKDGYNLRAITKATTAVTFLLIFACIGLTAKFIFSSLESTSASDVGSVGAQARPEGINSELLEKVSAFRANRQNRPSTATGQVRDPFFLPPTPSLPAPAEVQPPVTEQPTADEPTQPAP